MQIHSMRQNPWKSQCNLSLFREISKYSILKVIIIHNPGPIGLHFYTKHDQSTVVSWKKFKIYSANKMDGRMTFCQIEFSMRFAGIFYTITDHFRVWAQSQYKDGHSMHGIFTIKIRRQWDRLIFLMGVPILVIRHLILRQTPGRLNIISHHDHIFLLMTTAW